MEVKRSFVIHFFSHPLFHFRLGGWLNFFVTANPSYPSIAMANLIPKTVRMRLHILVSNKPFFMVFFDALIHKKIVYKITHLHEMLRKLFASQGSQNCSAELTNKNKILFKTRLIQFLKKIVTKFFLIKIICFLRNRVFSESI